MRESVNMQSRAQNILLPDMHFFPEILYLLKKEWLVLGLPDLGMMKKLNGNKLKPLLLVSFVLREGIYTCLLAKPSPVTLNILKMNKRMTSQACVFEPGILKRYLTLQSPLYHISNIIHLIKILIILVINLDNLDNISPTHDHCIPVLKGTDSG